MSTYIEGGHNRKPNSPLNEKGFENLRKISNFRMIIEF